MSEHQFASSPAKLLRQYRAWITPADDATETAREEFYGTAWIVPDTNVLLDLYQYTPATRGDLLAALRSVSSRLWLPHQVGLEFVRGRAGVIKRRAELLSRAQIDVNRAFDSAWKQIEGAAQQIKRLMASYAGPEGIGAIDDLIVRGEFDAMVAEWKSSLIGRAKSLKEEHDIRPNEFADGADDLLAVVSELFGENVGEPATEEILRHRVERASEFRFPNKIPPGYADSGKTTELLAAGDFLVWEEILEFAAAFPEPKVIFVSGDTKIDWYQDADLGHKKRPWPHLLDEFRARTSGEILIVSKPEFFENVKRYLGAEIDSRSIDEVNRPIRGEELGIPIADLGIVEPPGSLLAEACSVSNLSDRLIHRIATRPAAWLLGWWLIGVTRDLGMRSASDGEPLYTIQAILPHNPEPDWIQAGRVLRMGEFPYLSMYLAPWFAEGLQDCSVADRRTLLLLAHQHGSAAGFA